MSWTIEVIDSEPVLIISSRIGISASKADKKARRIPLSDFLTKFLSIYQIQKKETKTPLIESSGF